MNVTTVQSESDLQTQKADSGVPWLVIGCIAVAYVPLLFMHLRGLWKHEQYQYFPFVIAAIAYLLHARLGTSKDSSSTSRLQWLSTPLIVVSLLILASAALFQSAWLASVSFAMFAAAVCLRLATLRHIQNLWGIWLLIWLMIPPPLGTDRMAVVKLQNLSSRISSSILDILRVNHLMQGNVLEVPTKQFFVDEACSGIVSVMSVIACALIYAVWRNRTLIHLIVLVVSSVVWAIALNVARITVIAVAWDRWDWDLSSGWQHDTLGLVLFTLTFVAMISTDQLLAFGLRPIRSTPNTQVDISANNLVAVWNGFCTLFDPKRGFDDTNEMAPTKGTVNWSRVLPSLPQGFVFGLVGVVSAAPLGMLWKTNFDAVGHALTAGRDVVPAELGGLKLVGFEEVERPGQSELGDYSRTYVYEDEQGTKYTVSFDFPFSGGWHELCVCYKNTGWTLIERKLDMEAADADGEPWPAVRGVFERGSNEHGYVIFSNFNAQGHGLAPASEAIFWRPWRRLRRRLLEAVSDQAFQVQVWVGDQEPLSEAKLETADRLFSDLRNRFRSHMVEH